MVLFIMIQTLNIDWKLDEDEIILSEKDKLLTSI